MQHRPPPAGALGRALAALRDEGPWGIAVRLLSAAGYRRLLVLERTLDEPLPAPPGDLAVRCAALPADGFDPYYELRPDAARGAVAERLARGHACDLARIDGEPVAACWRATSAARIDYLGCELELDGDAAYLYDAFTAPAWRGRGIAPALCAHQLAALRAAGLARALRATWPENTAALRAHAKSGFRPVRRLTVVRLGSWQWRRDRPLARGEE